MADFSRKETDRLVREVLEMVNLEEYAKRKPHQLMEWQRLTLPICLNGRPDRRELGDRVNVLVRPEDLRVWHQGEIEVEPGLLPATVEEVIYKGTTVDLVVRLESGNRISASQFFNEDHDKLDHSVLC